MLEIITIPNLIANVIDNLSEEDRAIANRLRERTNKEAIFFIDGNG